MSWASERARPEASPTSPAAMGDLHWPPKNSTAAAVVQDADLAGRFFVVTGANTGIGLETARVLVGRNAHVTLACRNMEAAQLAKEQLLSECAGSAGRAETMQVDFADLHSVERFAVEYGRRGWPLHALVLNAGLFHPPRTHTKDGLETTFQVNHLGQMYLTQLLMELLKSSAPSRVVVVSSGLHRMSSVDVSREGALSPAAVPGRTAAMKAYAASKLCNVLFATELDRRVGSAGVRSFSLNPGSVDSELGRDDGLVVSLRRSCCAPFLQPLIQPVEIGAATSVFLATAAGLENHGGGYFEACRPVSPSRRARDKGAAGQLWATSERFIAQWKANRKS